MVAGSRSAEAELKISSAYEEGRRGTEDTVVAGSGITRKATAGTHCPETEGNLLLSAEERVRLKSKGTDDSFRWGAVNVPKSMVFFFSNVR